MTVELRPISNVGWLQRILYMAVGWNPTGPLPPLERVVAHPYLRMYWEDWGRAGDMGVAALIESEFAGGAFFRLFTDEEHGHGYIDPETPEVAVAVAVPHRGRGLGRLLMQELNQLAASAGIRRLSLSVDADNPAFRLYSQLGYVEVERDPEGVKMLLDLDSAPSSDPP